MSSHHVGKVSCFSEKYKCKFQIIQFHRAKFVPQNIPSPLSSSHSPSNILSVPCWDGTRLYQLNLHSVLLMFKLWPSSGFCSWAQFKQEKNGVTHWGFFFLIWSFCHQEFFPHPCYVGLMADLSSSALLPLKKLSLHPHCSHGKCWIRDLVLVPVLEGCKSISSQVLLNPSQYGFCLQIPLTWVSGPSHLAFLLLGLSAQSSFLLLKNCFFSSLFNGGTGTADIDSGLLLLLSLMLWQEG